MGSGVLMKAMPATVSDPNANIIRQGSVRADRVVVRERRGGAGTRGDQDARRFPQASPDEERLIRKIHWCQVKDIHRTV